MEYRLAHIPSSSNFDLKQSLMDELRLPEPVAQILCQRGFSSVAEVHDFLFPQLASLPSPELFHGMTEAVALVIEAFKQRNTVLVHGDYDVDGISATVLLVDFLRKVGLRVRYHVPNRLKERYGLSRYSIDTLRQREERGLLITVDCGISNVEEVAYAKSCGLRVVVTDHHEPPPELPAADALINPKLDCCAFPFTALSGVGVAFYLALALRIELLKIGYWTRDRAPNLKRYLDLVALGTVADVMPLIGVNRILVRSGLEVLSERVRPGILALCESANVWSSSLSSEDISFRLAPRLNAPGRLGKPELSIELLLSQSLEKARALALQIEENNVLRRQMEADILPEIFAQCQQQVDKGYQALTIYHKLCHPGIIGIAASRVVDRFGRPVLIFTDDCADDEDLVLKGSGRSIEGVNLHTVLCNMSSELVIQHGGHAMAVGLTVRHRKLDAFAAQFDAYVAQLDEPAAERVIYVDYQLETAAELNSNFTKILQHMQPFGEGNPEPVFLVRNQQLLNGQVVKSHLRFQVKFNQGVVQGIGFGLAGHCASLQDPVDLVFKLRRSSFKGVERDELQALHIIATHEYT